MAKTIPIYPNWRDRDDKIIPIYKLAVIVRRHSPRKETIENEKKRLKTTPSRLFYI